MASITVCDVECRSQCRKDSFRSGACFLFIAAQFAIALLSYPLSVCMIAGVFLELPFEISIPQRLLSCLVAIPYLFLMRFTRTEKMLLLGFCSLIAASSVQGDSTLNDAIADMGLLIVPFVMAHCCRELRQSGHGAWAWRLGFSLTWLSNIIVLVIWGITSGIGGNPNWMAPVLIATAPFAVLMIDSFADGTLGSGFRLYTILVISGLTLIGVLVAQCRASAVALLVYTVYWAATTLSLRRALAVLVATGSLTAAFAYTQSDAFVRKYYADIRGPLWESTARMIAEKPLLGFGPGNFQREIVPYKSHAFERRLQIGAVLEHPHNETFHLMATVGIPATLIWLYAIGCCLMVKPASIEQAVVAFALVTTIVHGCFDKSLAVSPSSVIFPLLLGVSWSYKERLVTSPLVIAPLKPMALVGSIVFAALAGFVESRAVILGSIYFRQGENAYNQVRRSRSSQEARELATSAYRLCLRASELNPRAPLYPFLAGIIASEDLDLPEEALGHFRAAKRIEPAYAFADYMLARVSLRSAIQEQRNEQRQCLARDAIRWLQRELEDHPYSTRVLEDLTLANHLTRDWQATQDSERRTLASYQSRFEMDCKADGADPKGRIAEWYSSGERGHRHRLNSAGVLIDAEAINELSNLTWLYCTGNRDVGGNVYAMKSGFSEIDSVTWSGWLLLKSHWEALTAEELRSRIGTVWIEDLTQRPMRWPWEVWRIRSGQPLEIAVLLAAACEIQKEPCILLHSDDRWAAVFRWDDEWHFYPITKASQIHKLGDDGSGLFDQIRVRWGIEGDGKVEASFFVLPAACCHRNRALWGVLSTEGDDSSFPRSPAVVLSELHAACPKLQGLQISLLMEPFERLFSDLQSQ